jgi:Holliday junction resolvasome RuvABC endonuclease subunit
MPKRILGINPGVNYIGYALFHDRELRDWGIKAVNQKWSKKKKQKIERIFLSFLDRHNPDYLAIKKVHPGRSSPELNKQITRLKELCRKRKIAVFEYPIAYLKETISGETGNRKFIKQIYRLYPLLFYEAEKELKMTEFEIQAEIQEEDEGNKPKKEFKNERDKRLQELKDKEEERKTGYYMTLFEAVALGHICFNQTDNP